VHVLVVNVGSRTVKLRVVDADDRVVASEDLGPEPPDEAVDAFVAAAPEVDAVGHRVVHGGRHHRPVVLDEAVLAELDELSALAPLHNPPALHMIRRLLGRYPSVPHYGCFDTAFHARLPDAAAVYAIPWEWTETHGIRRYGFHGLNHAYASRRAGAMLGRPLEDLRLVTCHLGGGASLAAVASGRSIDTTMGFTPLEGLVMATRSGSVDPGALLWLITRVGIDPAEVADALQHRSGLLGISGVSADVRDVTEAAAGGDTRAELALAVYVHRLRKELAAMIAVMSGADAVVFTGGVGEHSAEIRQATCDGLGYLGIGVDRDRNRAASTAEYDTDITARGAPVSVLVVHAREELEIAHQVRAALAR
jgi:acetate kinase